MNANTKEFFLKTLYAVAGLVIVSFISFLNSNPLMFGGSTAIIVGILSVIEQQFFPSGTTDNPPSAPAAPTASS